MAGASQGDQNLLTMLTKSPRFSAIVMVLLAVGVQAKEEEKEEVSQVNVGISVMLLGSIGFMMALFELTNGTRAAMQKATWKALGGTISIFSAVLLFQGVQGLIEAYLLEDQPEWAKLLINVLHFLVWFIFLQLFTAVICGVIPLKCYNPREDEPKVMKTRLMTFAILLGHVSGFAAINMFAEMQQKVPRNFYCDILMAPFAWFIIFVLGRITDFFREKHIMQDGDKNESEDLWDDVTEETEDDVVGLAVSFCFVQAVRFGIGGALPNAEGEEPEDVIVNHTVRQAMCLAGVGILLAFLEAVRVLYVKYNGLPRLMRQGKNVIGMTFSWCCFFGMDWYLSCTLFTEEQGMMKNVVLALCVTVVALGMIFVFMLAEASDKTSEQMDEAIRAVINAIGILIGFAWEKAFDVAVAEIAVSVHEFPEPVTKLGLACCLVLLVVPAWYRHILPTILRFEEEEEEEQEEVDKLEKGGHADQREIKEIEGVLKEPLLGDDSQDQSQLRTACEQYKKQIEDLQAEATRKTQANQQLEQKNQELEESIVNISKELSELQALADQLVA